MSTDIGTRTRLASALTKIPVRKDVAMTGEITLRGKVLSIGGMKEKLLAAHRAGIRTVILPKDNEKDMADIPEFIQKDFQIHFVETVDQVLQVALERPVESLAVLPPEAAIATDFEAEDASDQESLTH